MARRQFTFGLVLWGGLSRGPLESAAVACLFPVHLPLLGLTTSLLSAGLLRYPRWRRTGPLLWGLIAPRALPLSIPCGDQSLPWHPPWGSCEGAEGPIPVREGSCFPLETPGIKRVSRGEQRFSCWIIQHSYVSMGTSVGHPKTPWDHDAGPVRKAGRGCTCAHGLRAPADSTSRESPLLN